MIKHINNSVSFYNGNDICSYDNKNFANGTYTHDTIKVIFNDAWKPKIVKIDANTTLTIYFESITRNRPVLNCIIKNEMIVYNNPYKDRFVVVKLPNAIITRFDINNYIPSVERFDINQSGVFFSTTDIIIILLLLLISWVYIYFTKK